MQCSQCDSPATVQCNGDCNAAFCAEHDRSAHSNDSLALHQRTAVAQSNSSNIVSLSGGSGSSSHDVSSSAASATSSPASSSAPIATDTAAASASGTAVVEVRYVGECDEQGPHGFGCEVDAKGRMIAERCGVWSHGLLLEGRSVPLSLMPADLFAEERARGAVLLRENGEWYRGSADEQHCAYGDGSWFEKFGCITVERRGRFHHGGLFSGTLCYPNGVTFEGQLRYRRPHGTGVLTHPDGRSFKGEWSNDKSVSGALQSAPALSASDGKQAESNAAVRYVGELDSLNLPHGLGCEIDADGRMIEGRCGKWIHGSFALEGPLALRIVPQELFAEERARGVTLLSSNGEEYRGELDVEHRPHDTYEGQWKNGKRDGEGTLTTKAGCVTIGTWRNGELTRGKRSFLDGRTEQGSFFDGKLHGANCVIVEANGDRFEGTARFGVFVEGKLTRASGVIREGHWGGTGFESGTTTYPSGEVQRGTWLNGKLHDPACIIEWPHGDRYEGSVRHDKKDGVGRYAWKESGKVYAGEWANDKRAGFGVEMDGAGSILRCGVWNTGELVTCGSVPLSHLPANLLTKERELGAILVRATGDWYRGAVDHEHRPHGEGCWLFADGRVKAKGSFDHGDQTNGFRERPDGSTYEGEWTDGNADGDGKYTGKADGVFMEGNWRGGVLVSGKCTWPDGGWQQGDRVDGKLHGPACIVVWPNDNCYEGAIQHNQFEGVGKFTSKESGNTEEGQWTNHQQHGFAMERSRDGEILKCGLWENNNLIKSCPVPRFALPDGSLPHAEDALLMPDGRTFRGETNAQHQPHGSGSMHRADGSEESRGDWVNGALTGLGLLRYPNGDVFEGHLVDGQPKGFGVLWNAQGEIRKCGEWGSAGRPAEVDSQPVSYRFIPFGDRLNELARGAPQYLLYPESGGFFVGPLNAQDKPNGVGKLYWPSGVVKQQGLWSDGVYSAVPAAVIAEVAPSEPVVAMDVDTAPAAPKSDAALQPEIPPASAMSPTLPPRRRSLLSIGINKYAPPLEPRQCCWNDAERVHNAMLQLKFDSSIVRTDLDRSSLSNEIDEFIATLAQQRYGPGDLAVLYFSGHGCEMGTNNVYLLPTDIGCEDADQGGLSVQMIKRRFNRQSGSLRGVQVVIIVECCRVGECSAITVDLDACEKALKQAHADQCAAERRVLAKEAAAKRAREKQQEAEECKYSFQDDSESDQSEPSYSQSESSLAVPTFRPQESIPSHKDDLARNHVQEVYSCVSGHAALTDFQGGSLFTTCLTEQMKASSAGLDIDGLVRRTNVRMQRVLDDRGEGQVQMATAYTSSTETITLAAERQA